MKDQTFNIMGCRDAEAFGSISPLIQATCEDQTDNTGVGSKVLEKEVRIPLKDILNVGSAKMFDTNRLGRCHLNLELDMARLSANNANFDQDFYTTNNNGACVIKSGLHLAEGIAAAYHIGRTVFEVGKCAAPYLMAAV